MFLLLYVGMEMKYTFFFQKKDMVSFYKIHLLANKPYVMWYVWIISNKAKPLYTSRFNQSHFISCINAYRTWLFSWQIYIWIKKQLMCTCYEQTKKHFFFKFIGKDLVYIVCFVTKRNNRVFLWLYRKRECSKNSKRCEIN